MQLALELARKGAGRTSPNPRVGAVLVKGGRIIGQGYHRAVGEKHAEVEAIEAATESVEGATLICNLEPCCHNTREKRTPPCTRRIIAEKIARVVVSTIDPNPHVNGQGLAELQAAGIEVKTGVLAREALELNAAYFKSVHRREAFFHLKIAQSLDGRIATRRGDSKWITDQQARRQVQALRRQADAILVGVGTVLADNPRLTVREESDYQPYRLVLDSRLRTPLEAHLVRDRWAQRTLIFHGPQADVTRKRKLAERGVRLVEAPVDAAGRIDLAFLAGYLAAQGILAVLVEGGSRVFTEFVRQNRFDRLTAFVAPLLIGEGLPAIGDLGVEALSEARRLEQVRIHTLGNQAVVEGYRRVKETFGPLAEVWSCSRD
ncbi:MAG: bifunctional diaminohydroxyphosphoribosylaminopyrimidine deaminase/5-amino-6-(5-phosphoribosylamino)uracil reductase RibD [Calditrichaeota bacterium]|nr:MAG: bifunctional diaminohydroxyphosphoribosylaminopyrimidine deaminase/5-amino-6-(5-phosphoribosylamino)uracil reductase RibD [Calditrichota bacterium]